VPEKNEDAVIFGIPNSAVIVGVPVLANFAIISFFTGYCKALGIPLWYISVSPVQVFIVGLFSVPFAWLAVALYLKLKKARLTPRLGDDLTARTLWVSGLTLLVIAVTFAWGFLLPFVTPSWAVVAGSPKCVVLTRIGDNVIASDFDPGSARLKPRLSSYPIDKVPPLDLYRVRLNLRAGPLSVKSAAEPADCPRQ
jgi:hypothetical protein